MGFQSFSQIAKEQRKGKGRGSSAPKSLLSFTQKSYDEEGKRSVMTLRISEEAMNKARFEINDKVDIAHDPERKLWQVSLIDEGSSGYSISGSKTATSKTGTVRFSLYEGMATIADEKPANSSRMFSDDESVETSPGKIIFGLDESTLIVRPDKPETDPLTNNRLQF